MTCKCDHEARFHAGGQAFDEFANGKCTVAGCGCMEYRERETATEQRRKAIEWLQSIPRDSEAWRKYEAEVFHDGDKFIVTATHIDPPWEPALDPGKWDRDPVWRAIVDQETRIASALERIADLLEKKAE